MSNSLGTAWRGGNIHCLAVLAAQNCMGTQHLEQENLCNSFCSLILFIYI